MNAIPATVERAIVWSVRWCMRLKRRVASAHDGLTKIINAVQVVCLVVGHEHVRHVALEGRVHSAHHKLPAQTWSTMCQRQFGGGEHQRGPPKGDSVTYQAVQRVCHGRGIVSVAVLGTSWCCGASCGMPGVLISFLLPADSHH